ncbi:MAG: tannase/feruloyl esterase family alpha/beta hydrolase, partial [Saprospiraceae bacterium]|nr:tannase/feruloyl esterase family alpha/beta hydrolase [Saprospiraceae bacterium]
MRKLINLSSRVLHCISLLAIGFLPTEAQQSSMADKRSCIRCQELKELDLPDVRILSALSSEENYSHCKVLGVISKEINFELLLPDDWNGRFLMSGGGGFVGSIQNGARARTKDGYATAGTDTGHKGPGIKADWALNHMERMVNFGHLAVHRTAVTSKAIIAKYYCSKPEYSYFMGCSRGGGQALIEAQRYPNDFNGIVAGAPIIDWPATGAEFIQNTRALFPDPSQIDRALISPAQVELLEAQIFKQCDDLDGLKDEILNDPRDCEFDFSGLPACEEGGSSELCFTLAQIAVLKKIYQGPRIEGKSLYPGFPYGCENQPGGWGAWISGPNEGAMELNFPSLHFAFGTEMFKYLIFQDPKWDYSKYDFSNFERDTRFAASFLNAGSTNYESFNNQGGKLIIWHGWNDHALSAFTAIDHFNEVNKNESNADDFLRLYLIPGMLHCGGGTGPGQADWLQVISDWVENGQ